MEMEMEKPRRDVIALVKAFYSNVYSSVRS